MTNIIQIKRGTRAQIEAAKTTGQLKDGEPYLIIDENRIAVGIGPNGYSSFLKQGEGGVDEKVAVTPSGPPGYLWGSSTNNGLVRPLNNSVTIEKAIDNSYIQLAVGDVDLGTF